MLTKLETGRRGTAATVSAGLCALLALSACGGTTKNSTTNAASSGPASSAAAGSTSAAAASSGGSSGSTGSYKTGLTVAFLPKQINNPYFTIADNGGLAALKKLNETGKAVGPSDASASSQVTYINTLTQQHVDAIVISANDANAVVPSLKNAMNAGIKVVSFDSDTAPDGRNVFVSQASSEDLGRTEVQLLGKQINYTGDIAILSATANATNQNTWIKYMKDELTKPQYKNMHLVKIAYGNDDDQTSFQQTQGLLQAYPKLKGIISPTTVGIAAAARYLDGSSYKGKVQLTGLGDPNQMRKYVKDGTVQAFELWDPGKLGELAAYTAVALCSGTISGKQGDTFTAGDMGKFTVGADQTVLLGKPTVFDKSNIDQFQF